MPRRQSSLLFCIKFAYKIDLLTHLGTRDSGPKSVEYLAEKTSTETQLLDRVCRNMAAHHILVDCTDPSSPGQGAYAPTRISEFLATPEAAAGMRQAWIKYYPDFTGMAEYLVDIGRRSPTDNRDGSFQRRFGLRGLTYFECMQRRDVELLGSMADEFDLIMALMKKGQSSFLDVCDVDALLRARPVGPGSEYLFVDLGGGVGANAVDFRQRFAGVAGTVEVQELDRVVNAARGAHVEDQGVALRVHNFFDPEPVHGARFYCLSIVLHDWPDEEAKKILASLVPAMKKGYSTLLISEMVIPNRDCPPDLSAMDINMMTYFAGKERSERDWQVLLEGVGLTIVKVHSTPTSMRSVLECER